MNKFLGKILMLTVSALLLSAGVAFAGPSADWNDSWGFPTPFEKANALEQALAIELVEEDGFNNQTTYFGTNDTYIGTGIWQIDNSINDSILDSFNTQDSFNKTKTKTITTTTNQTTTNSNNTTTTNK